MNKLLPSLIEGFGWFLLGLGGFQVWDGITITTPYKVCFGLAILMLGLIYLFRNRIWRD